MRAEARNRRIASADEARFSEIYRRHGKMIHAYCARRIDGSQVPDAVAETFAVAWRKIDQIPEGEGALPWLYGVAYRVLSHQWRSKARNRRLGERLLGLAEFDTASPDVILIRNEEHRLVIEASNRLRPIDQEILRLTLWEELSHLETAAVLGIEATAVKQRAYRARRNLTAEYMRLTRDHQPPSVQRGGGS